jgi:hypothetical protein
MSQLTQGARSPTAQPFVIATGAVNGTTVTRVVIRLRRPSGTTVDVYDGAPTSATTTSVTATWVLASDGSSLPEASDHWWVATLYAGATRLADTDEEKLPVAPRRVPLP